MSDQKAEVSFSGHPDKPCPVCHDGYLRRIKRESWMTWIPSSKYYSCSKCKARFLRVFDSFGFRVEKNVKRKRELAIMALAIVAAVFVCWRIVISLYENVVQQANYP